MKDIKYKVPSKSFGAFSAPNTAGAGRTSRNISTSVSEYYMLPIDNLRPYSKQARKIFSDEELGALATSIKNYGVRQPLSVIRKIDDPGVFEIISGERRARAAKLAGLEKVPCIIISDTQNAEAIAVIENIQRKDLHPVELARAYNFLKENGNFKDLKSMWETIGVNETSGYEILNILKLPEDLQEKLLDVNLPRQLIRCLVKADNPYKVLSDIQSGRVRKTHSVLKVLDDNGNFTIQKNALTKLSPTEREKLKGLLLQLLETL